MVLCLGPDRRSGQGHGAAGPRACAHDPASHAHPPPREEGRALTFVAPLSLPLNDSHQSCTPWSVFQDGSVHSAALMTGHPGRSGRGAAAVALARAQPRRPAGATGACLDERRHLGARLQRLPGYKASAARAEPPSREACAGLPQADQPGQGAGTGPGHGCHSLRWARAPSPGGPCPDAE